MKRLLLVVLFVLTSVTMFSSGDTYVYICTGPQSARYHKASSCKGLGKCSKEIKKVTVEEARSIGRTPCGYCYKRR